MYQEDITDLKWKTEQQVCNSHGHQYYVWGSGHAG